MYVSWWSRSFRKGRFIYIYNVLISCLIDSWWWIGQILATSKVSCKCNHNVIIVITRECKEGVAQLDNDTPPVNEILTNGLAHSSEVWCHNDIIVYYFAGGSQRKNARRTKCYRGCDWVASNNGIRSRYSCHGNC